MSAELQEPARGVTEAPDSFIFEQDVPLAVWNIAHNLGFFPNVAIVDTLGREYDAQVDYVDENNLTVTFAAPFTGKAYLS